jgi:hypothetical protein
MVEPDEVKQTTREFSTAQKGSVSMTEEPKPSSASTASGEQEHAAFTRKETASMAGTDPESARTASHKVEYRRTTGVTAREQTRPNLTSCICPGKQVPNNPTSFHADAASARQARLRFEATTRGTEPTAAEQVRSRLVTPVARTPPSSIESGHPTIASLRGDDRNTDRLKRADATDRETLGESPHLVHSHTLEPLPSDASLFFPEPIVGPSDEFVPPPWFLNEIKKICATESPTPTKSPIRFKLSQKAAEHNETVLERVGFDVGRLIQDSSSSTLGFGSEFRRVSELEPLQGKHPHVAQLAKLLTKGMHYVFH